MTKYAARSLVLSMDGDEIGQITSMGEVGSARDLIDASAYGDDWKDYVLGQQDGTEVELILAYDPSDGSQTALQAAYLDAVDHDFELTHDDSGFDAFFPAKVLQVTTGGARDGLLQLTASLKIVNPGVTLAS